MIISHTSPEVVSIKTKTETIIISDGVKIGNYQISGAGEYDIATIQCESQFLNEATIYFLRAEELTVAFLSQIDVEAIKLDSASNTDILIVDVRSDSKLDDLKSIIKGVEPSYVLLIGAGATDEFRQALALTPNESPTLKITRAGLPLEGTFLIPLS